MASVTLPGRIALVAVGLVVAIAAAAFVLRSPPPKPDEKALASAWMMMANASGPPRVDVTAATAASE